MLTHLKKTFQSAWDFQQLKQNRNKFLKCDWYVYAKWSKGETVYASQHVKKYHPAIHTFKTSQRTIPNPLNY